MRSHRRMWTWAAVLAVFVVLLFAAKTYYFSIAITVRNQSDVELKNLQIAIAGEDAWSGRLAAGETHTVRREPKASGTIALSLEANGRTIRKEYGYVAPQLREDHTIVVLHSLEVQYRSRVRSRRELRS
jgi:hypothetical protein